MRRGLNCAAWAAAAAEVEVGSKRLPGGGESERLAATSVKEEDDWELDEALLTILERWMAISFVEFQAKRVGRRCVDR